LLTQKNTALNGVFFIADYTAYLILIAGYV